MEILISGLAIFLGIHLLPTLPSVHGRVRSALGETRYKATFSVISAIGLATIIVGYARAPAEPRLFDPFPLAVMIAPLAIAATFILLAATYMTTHIRRTLRHPMLVGIALWAGVHLLANGEARATILFGAFLAYALVDLASATARGNVKSFTPVLRHDVLAVVAGGLLALLVMLFHRQLFGVAAVPWGI